MEREGDAAQDLSVEPQIGAVLRPNRAEKERQALSRKPSRSCHLGKGSSL